MLEAIILGAFVRLDATAELGQCILRTRDRAVWSSREPKLQQPVNRFVLLHYTSAMFESFSDALRSLLCFRFALDVVLRMLATRFHFDYYLLRQPQARSEYRPHTSAANSQTGHSAPSPA
jgi:hypothetical protein